MKKMFLFVCMLLMVTPVVVKADHIYNIDVNIYIAEDGSAHITEAWDVQADGGTEWCKLLSNLENSEVRDFYVLMDEKELEAKEWTSGGSLKEKAGYYGTRYVSGGLELCFGKSDMERHRFTFSYDVSDYVITTEDSQVLYHVLTPEVTADIFYADVVSYYGFPDELEVWGFGYKGNSYVDSGRIILSNFDGMNKQYATILVKFPLKTFKNNKTLKKFNTFDDVYKDAESAGYEYGAASKGKTRFTFLDLFFVLLSIFVILLIVELIVRKVTGKSILKHEKVKIVLDKIGPIFRKIWIFIKKIFRKLIVLLKKLIEKIKKLIDKIRKKS